MEWGNGLTIMGIDIVIQTEFCLSREHKYSGVSGKQSCNLQLLSSFYKPTPSNRPIDMDSGIGSSRPVMHHFQFVCADGNIFQFLSIGRPSAKSEQSGATLLPVSPQRKDGLFSLQVVRWFSVLCWEKGYPGPPLFPFFFFLLRGCLLSPQHPQMEMGLGFLENFTILTRKGLGPLKMVLRGKGVPGNKIFVIGMGVS